VYKEYNDEMTAICKELLWKFYGEWKSFESDSDREAWVNGDPWLKQLDWEVKTQKGKYAGVPNWVRPFIKDPDAPVGVKSRLAHLLLKLTWEGQPLTWVEDQGWCYWVEDHNDDDDYD
jgi:DNA polymerase gamma 1